MRRVAVVATFFAALVFLSAFGAVACGGNDKPPLQPDSEHPMVDDAGGASTPSTPSSAAPPSK
jgi:hypothetical protein